MSDDTTARALAALATLRALSVAPDYPGGRCQVAVTPETLDAVCDVAEAAARLRAAQRDYDNLWRDVISDTSIVTRLSDEIHNGLKALDAALARLAEVAE